MLPAIRIAQVHKRYGDIHALKGIDFEIFQGEYFGLLGPNGAGKSTLINTVAGLVRASSGAVEVLGHDVVRDYRGARRSLGLVPQELVYDPFFPVRQMLQIQAGYYGKGREQWPWIARVLAALDLEDKLDLTMRQLSGGMKRRVLIAQALVHRPPVVILDEPTAGVDVELRRTLWNFTRELHADGHTIVLTTHYLEEAEALCERIAILNRGELRVLQEKQALLDRAPYRYVRVTLRDGAEHLPAALRSRVIDSHGDELEFRLHRDRDRLGDILEAVADAGLRVDDVHTREPSLEDVFVDLTMGEPGAPHV